MSLLTENNRQYYEGAQGFQGDGTNASFTTTFNTDLVFGAASNTAVNYPLNNFKLYSSASGAPSSWSEVVSGYSVSGNTITFDTPPANGDYIVVQLKKLDGGNYGSTTSDKAFGDIVEENYGSYAYIKLIGFPFNTATGVNNVHMGNLYFSNMGSNYISIGLQYSSEAGK